MTWLVSLTLGRLGADYLAKPGAMHEAIARHAARRGRNFHVQQENRS